MLFETVGFRTHSIPLSTTTIKNLWKNRRLLQSNKLLFPFFSHDGETTKQECGHKY
eukprot:m.40403 g.40403  ORF g.40403 m.40403 type:complete len:56 (-) comp9661_c0_seq2:144-311(-)